MGDGGNGIELEFAEGRCQLKKVDEVVVECKGGGEMDEVWIGRMIAEDPSGRGVDEEVKRVKFGHVVEGVGEGGVKAGEDRGSGVECDVKGPNMACDMGFLR